MLDIFTEYVATGIDGSINKIPNDAPFLLIFPFVGFRVENIITRRVDQVFLRSIRSVNYPAQVPKIVNQGLLAPKPRMLRIELD